MFDAPATVNPKPDGAHYQALDGLRGVAAVGVFMLHKIWLFNTHISQVQAIRGLNLAVDFFFVLSGFVIAFNYQNRLMARAISVKKFMILRLARIYPLHIVLILCYAPKFIFFGGAHKLAVFAVGLGLNALLLQSMVFTDQFCWNGPSWSISTEFWTYGLFALYGAFCLPWRYNRIFLVGLSAGLVIFLALTKDNMDIGAPDYGWLRCIADFSMGALLFNILPDFQRVISRLPPHLTEISAAILGTGFVVVANHNAASFLVPFVFFVIVGIFTLERGMVSRLLKTRPLQELGKLSYSIYMNHFILTLFYLAIIHGLISHQLFSDYSIPPVGGQEILLGKNLWLGDSYFIVALAGLILMSYATYYGIEKPCREWARRKFAALK